MANVFGNIGDQQVELNNAASEATLNALLEVAKAQFNSQTKGKDAKAQRDLEKKLRDLAAATVSATKTVKTEEQIRNKSIRAIREETKARRQSVLTSENLKKVATKTTNELAYMATSIARMGDSVSAATQVMTSMVKQIPLVGGALGGFADAVAGAIEGTQKSFMAASSVGANFGASINDMINSASGAGLTIDQFTGIISRSGENLSLLGKGTADGAKLLSKFGEEIRRSPYQDQLANLGYSTEEVNESLVTYGARLRRSGMSQEQINNTLIESTVDYLKNLDAVSKLTGQSRKDLEAQRSARRADSQFRAMIQGKDEKTVEALDTMLDGLDKSQQQAFKEIAATGTAQSEAAQALFYQSPILAQNAMKVFSQLESGGQLSMDMIKNMHGAAQTEANLMMDQNKFLAKFGNETQKQLALGSMNLANRSTTLAKSLEQTAKTAGVTSKEFGEMDPAQLVKTQQEIAESSNEMTRTLLRMSGTLLSVLEKFQNGIQYAVGMIDDFSEWIDKAWKKIKEWMEIFDTSGIGGIFGKLSSAIFNGMTDGVNFLISKAIEIGEKMGTGLINIMPKWMKTMFGMTEKNDTRSTKEKERDELVSMLTAARQNVAAQGVEDEEQTQAMNKLENQIKNLNDQIEAEKNAPNVPSKANIDTDGGVSQGVETLTNSFEAQADATAEWAKSGQEQWAADDKRRKEQAEQDRKGREATEDLTKATKDLAKETKASSSCELDYSSPQALFNSFAKIMVGGKPGATDTMTGASVATSTGEDEMFSGVGPSNMQNYLKTVAMIESSGDPSAKAKTSSASGMFQFTKGTWEETVKAMGKDYSQEDRFDPKKATEVMEFFTKRQKAQLEKSTGKSASDVDMYMAHFLGAGGAGKFINAMSASPNASAADVVGPEAASANKNIFYKNDQARSLQEVYNLMASKYQKHESNVLTGNIPAVVASVSQHMTPSGSQAFTAMTPEKESPSGLNPVAQTGNGGTTTSQPGPGAAGASAVTTISSLAEQLETLNSSVGQLVAYTEASLKLTEKHITATRSLSTDQFT